MSCQTIRPPPLVVVGPVVVVVVAWAVVVGRVVVVVGPAVVVGPVVVDRLVGVVPRRVVVDRVVVVTGRLAVVEPVVAPVVVWLRRPGAVAPGRVDVVTGAVVWPPGRAVDPVFDDGVATEDEPDEADGPCDVVLADEPLDAVDVVDPSSV